jgi:H+/Na+-translocating ferredoxin:NAD+ oxidoreductase subunit G
MKNNLRLGLILFIITALTGLILGAANSVTAGPIAETAAKAKQAAMKEILPKADEFKEVENKSNDTILEVNAGYKNNEIVGYALKVAPKGYGGAVQMMVGISNEGTIGGIKILSHSETPGLGANAPKPKFSGQFANKSISKQLQVKKGKASKDNEIQALTGATITSRAVTGGVNNAIDFYKSELNTDSKNASEENNSDATIFEANTISDGYSIKVEANGFGGTICVEVALSNDGIVKNVQVLSHSETDGLGTQVTDPEFLSQFIDKTAETFKLTNEDPSDDNAVQAISGATVSSTAITNAVNLAVEYYNSNLKGGQN